MTTRFIAKMEDVLDVYQRPYDPCYPLVCLDEKGKELRADKREALPARAGSAITGSVRQDYEYQRQGSANLLLMCEPLRGWRQVVVTEDRTARSFARQLQHLVDEIYPQAAKVVLVSDNLNIHGIWSLYEVFSPAEARRIINRLEWHYTPEHGSWLNIAELELSVLARQCLNRRFADKASLQAECEAWSRQRNQREVKINWQFTTADARIRLRRLYPILEFES